MKWLTRVLRLRHVVCLMLIQCAMGTTIGLSATSHESLFVGLSGSLAENAPNKRFFARFLVSTSQKHSYLTLFCSIEKF